MTFDEKLSEILLPIGYVNPRLETEMKRKIKDLVLSDVVGEDVETWVPHPKGRSHQEPAKVIQNEMRRKQRSIINGGKETKGLTKEESIEVTKAEGERF